MIESREEDDLAAFVAARGELTALAYRMLGDGQRAEDVVQEAWLRWRGREEAEIRAPRAFLITVVTRLCLNELDSARARREESRADRLPEPLDLAEAGIDPLETRELVTMAFLVVLAELAPAERAVLLLHDVFDFAHDDIAPLVGKSPAACRKALERARKKVASARHAAATPREEHHRLLEGFVRAFSAGDVPALVELLAKDAVLVTDGGPSGRREAGLRNLKKPLHGAVRVAAFVAATARAGAVEIERRDLNGL
ncbi:MAG TPA: sigma-70 family RNA polymerase sigma factor, partial [Minicystis sp.]|nr:sigma-70 family RNA polymerase sigma factor [Minicystis sp.]